MDYLGNSILQLTGSDPAILAAILALEAQQQFGSVACIADAGETPLNGSQPVTQTTFFTARQIDPFFRRGYAQAGFAVSTNISQGDYLYALRENNLLTGLRWERRGTEPALAKILITALLLRLHCSIWFFWLTKKSVFLSDISTTCLLKS